VPQRLVETWVAEFCRTGMASLREQPDRIASGELVWLRFSRPVRTLWRKITIGLRRFLAGEPSAQPLPLRRSREDGSD
jgi:hypothetical protein